MMIKTIDGTTITLDFTDEVAEIPLCITQVKDETKAESYARVFEKDMRNFYSDMFPEPVIEYTEEMMGE